MTTRWRFLLALSALLAIPLAAQDTWTGVPRVVAIGDVHGDFQQFVAILRGAGVADNRNRWIGGKTHLVQTGDVVDRGAGSRKVMDLLMELEKQAARAGGRVHALIGNHEAMNVYGDLRYVAPAEYEAFRDGHSEQVREAFWTQHAEELRKAGGEQAQRAEDETYRRRWLGQYPLGWFEHRFHFGPKGKYGKWIRAHNSVIRINDTLFLHGGIGPKYAAATRQQINATIRAELEDITKVEGGMAADGEGPLWYRGLADGDESALSAHLDAVLTAHGARRMVIGHTVTDAVLPRYGGRVVMIDVGLSSVYGGPPACLILEGDKAFAMHRGTRLELPADNGPELVRYLKQVAALEPEGSALRKRVGQ
jgi:hypothetical protein